MIKRRNDMAVQIDDNLKKLFEDETSIKLIGTVDKNGVPHVVRKQYLTLDENHNLLLYELLESSRNNRNLVYSLWFDKLVSVQITKNNESYEVIARPVKSVTAGHDFERIYENIREKLGDVDLGAIWTLIPVEIRNESFLVRQREEEEQYPILRHLDRVTVS